MGLGAALNIAGNALNVFSTGVQVTGQNLANATTPGYIVEDLNLQTAPSYGVSPLVLGSGVRAAGVTQQVNQYLQQQILAPTPTTVRRISSTRSIRRCSNNCSAGQ